MKEAMTYLYVTVKYASHHQPGRYSIEKGGVKYWSLTYRERDTLFLLSNSAILSDEKEDEIGSGKHKLVQHFSSQSWDRYALLHGRIYRESANTVASAPQPVNLSKSGPKNSPFLFSFFFFWKKKRAHTSNLNPLKFFSTVLPWFPFIWIKFPLIFFSLLRFWWSQSSIGRTLYS